MKIKFKGKYFEIEGEKELLLFFEKVEITQETVFFIDLKSNSVIQRRDILKSKEVEIKPLISGG